MNSGVNKEQSTINAHLEQETKWALTKLMNHTDERTKKATPLNISAIRYIDVSNALVNEIFWLNKKKRTETTHHPLASYKTFRFRMRIFFF